MLKFLPILLIGGFALMSFTAKGMDLKETINKLNVTVSSLSKPFVTSGTLYVPVRLKFDNSGSASIKLDSIFARISTVDSSGIETNLATTRPQITTSEIKANSTTYRDIQFTIPVLSGLSSINALYRTKKFIIRATPKVHGFDVPEIQKEFNVDIKNLVNSFSSILSIFKSKKGQSGRAGQSGRTGKVSKNTTTTIEVKENVNHCSNTIKTNRKPRVRRFS